MRDPEDFEEFLAVAQPRLRRGFIAARGIDGAADAVAEAMAWAWEHREEVRQMTNPVGYLYRVGLSKTRGRAAPSLPPPEQLGLPDIEPMLIPALLQLSTRQRTAVWLVHGCGWRYREAAEAMGLSPSAVGTHVSRALEHLRSRFEVYDGA